MKLAVFFGIDSIPYVVHWDRLLTDFHIFFRYDDKYWQWVCHDRNAKNLSINEIKGVDWYLIYGKCDIGAIPMDIFGQRQPTPEFKTLFNIYTSTKTCECGSEKVHGKNTGHSTWCPKWSKA